MLNILFLAAAVTSLPPLPPGYVPPSPKPLTPKYAEHLQSLGTPMAKTMLVPTVLKVPIQGFLVTNISVASGQVTLGWQDGQPVFQVQGQQNLLGPWQNIGQPTTAQTKTFPIDQNKFFRVVGSNYMQLSITHTNPTTLTWDKPDTDMSDTLQSFRVYRAPSLPVNDTPSSTAGWTEIINGTPPSPIPTNETLDANGKFHIDDPTQPNPTLFYKIIEQTANGVVVPYNVQSASNAAPGSAVWTRGFGGTLNDSAGSVANFPTGGFIVTGYFKGTANFGTPNVSGSVAAANLTAPGSAGMFIAKYDANGAHQWSVAYGGTGQMQPIKTVVDASGNIFICGLYQGGGTGNCGGADFPVVFQGSAPQPATGAFVAKYNSLGQHQWSHGGSFESSQSFVLTSDCEFDVAAIDASGNLIVGGSFKGWKNFGTPDNTHPASDLEPTSIHSYALCLVAYDTNGHHLWSEVFDNGGDCRAHGMALDSNGFIILAGEAYGYIAFGTTTLNSTGGGQAHSFLAKLSPNGGVPGSASGTWANMKGSPMLAAIFFSVAVDSFNDIFVAGGYTSNVDLGSGTRIVGFSTGLDGFIAKYSGVDGSYLLANQIKGTGTSTQINGLCMAIDPSNSIFIGGFFLGTYDFDGKSVGDSAYNSAFLARYNFVSRTAIAISWANWFTESTNRLDCGGNSLVLDPSGVAPIMAGYFSATFQDKSSATSIAVSKGGADGFLMKINR